MDRTCEISWHFDYVIFLILRGFGELKIDCGLIFDFISNLYNTQAGEGPLIFGTSRVDFPNNIQLPVVTLAFVCFSTQTTNHQSQSPRKCRPDFKNQETRNSSMLNSLGLDMFIKMLQSANSKVGVGRRRKVGLGVRAKRLRDHHQGKCRCWFLRMNDWFSR